MTEKIIRTPKLHQILAIESNIRKQTQKDLTVAHHSMQKTSSLEGLSRTYTPVNDDGEKLPAEVTLLQTRTPEILRKTAKILEKMYNITAARDYANCTAKADVVLDDGSVLISGAPATFLLWLEKKLDDMHTLVSKLPILPTDIEWEFDSNQNCFKNKNEIKTHRTQKIFYPLVLSEATEHHPAQVAEKSRDEIVGYWNAMRYSGAMEAQTVQKMKERVEQLQKAVKFAREKANTVEAPEVNVGENMMRFIFGDILEVG